MIDYNCNNKARGLLEKARSYASQANDSNLKEQIEQKLANLAA